MTKILTFGVFDFFHLGHLRLFKQMKQYGDYLIVAVQNESYIKVYKPEAKILYSTEERIELVEAISIVDEVITYDSANIDTVSKIDFDILALGEDQNGSHFIETARWCEAVGKRVIRLKRTPGITSANIKTSI